MYSIIYEPKLRDNEEKSADLFMGFASEALTEVRSACYDHQALISPIHRLVKQMLCEYKLYCKG